jgi:ribA/ribD-fused uncharacterized protein
MSEQNTPISGFFGEYRFLSNFYPCTVEYERIVYPSSEHAYQAAKTVSRDEKRAIAALQTAGQAKKYGQGIRVYFRPDWDSVKVSVMEAILRVKFKAPELAERLVATGQRPLIEDNRWGDSFWGVYKGLGENNLGRTLMKIREELLGASLAPMV